MKTFSLKAADIEKNWLLIDAEGMALGRLASRVAYYLRGKHKATFSPNMDCGDNVIIINAKKVRITGRKREQDVFYWHTGYPGGIKQRTKGQILDGRFPERVMIKAVQRMLPKGPLGRQMLRNLRVYADDQHPHDAQKPQVIDFAAMNPKNKRDEA